MKKLIIYIFAFVAIMLCYNSVQAVSQSKHLSTRVSKSARNSDTAFSADKPVSDARPSFALPDVNDTLVVEGDSALILSDTSNVRQSRLVRKKVDMDNAVQFKSTDSLILIGRDTAIMYGNSTVSYGEFDLTAAQIEMDLANNNVYAMGVRDTSDEIVGRPIFSEGGSDYEADTMRYNFKSRKGMIYNVVTEQGEGYLIGDMAKKDADDNYYFRNGKYTTCDDHDCPHFYFQITKGKMRPGKDVVTGPTYMVLAGLPLPIALPFGYFPFTESYASGIIVPTFGDDYNRGFYLRDGGYYLALSDNIDLALTGELYTKGSWGLGAQSRYVKRYKYSGNFNINYLKTILGDKGMPDYSKQTNFQVLWSHTQDSKANPSMSLSASVNFTTSGYTRNDLNSYYSSAFTENTKSSAINMTYRIPNSKWSLSTSLNLSQRTQDSTLSVSFPNLSITMSQSAPFKRKRAVGAERWYEKIKLSYSGQLQNSLTAKQDQFFKKSLVKDWRNAMKHSVPIAATFNVFKYFNLTPSVNLQDRMYTQKVRRLWDPNAAAEVLDTCYNFYNVFDFNAAISLDTKIYGFYRPLKIFGNKVKMIRHVITPTLSFSGAPDFGDPFWGYYGTIDRVMPNGTVQQQKYSYFPNAIFGVPGQGKQGSLNMAIANNLEMKVRSDNDSIEDKKISLIENLTLSQSYNFAADSLRWSNLNTSVMIRVTKGFNLNLAAVWDVYTYGLNEYGNPVRINKTRLQAGKGYGRLSSTGTSFSYTINNDTFKRKKDKKSDKKNASSQSSDADTDGTTDTGQSEHDHDSGLDLDADGYMKWSVPWSLSLNYSISYGYGTFNYDKMEYNGRVTQNLSFSGNIRPTKNWNFSFTASYDFNVHKLAYMNCNIGRDLHCFQMRASFVPVGPYKSYSFSIAVKSAMLSDLKYDKRSSMSNGVSWY